VHLITLISVAGIAITTAALVILISAFNGIGGMVERLYSAYDAPVTVRSDIGKTFKENTVDLKALERIEGVKTVSRAVEETVILKHEKKWVNAQMVGIDASYLKTIDIDTHVVDGYPTLEENGKPTAIIGATLLDKLDGYISDLDGYEQLTLYTPLRDASISRRKSPFRTTDLRVACRMNYNREVNAQYVLVPLAFAQEQLSYDAEITALYIGLDPRTDPFDVKERLQTKLGKNFVVKTAAEKNELIFKTSESEKRVVIIILVFVFVLAAFNLIASLTMLFIEKKENIVTMMHYGASPQFIFRIFFFDGLLISARGIVIGIVLGTAVCLAQIYGEFLVMPNTNGEAFPIAFTWQDGLLIIGLVSALSIVTSFLPVYYLVRKTSIG
jgi:lipoprotein-releasing system permease protein